MWWDTEIEFTTRRSVTNDIASAIGLVQLKKANQFINHRRMVYDHYYRNFNKVFHARLPDQVSVTDNYRPSFYFFWIYTSSQNVRNRLAHHLRDNGIYTNVKYKPLHYISIYGRPDKFPLPQYQPNASDVYKRMLNLPIHQNLIRQNVDDIIEAIRNFRA